MLGFVVQCDSVVFPGSQPTGDPSLQSCDTYTGDILPAIVPRYLTEMEKGFVLCSLLGTQFITVRQHGVITQSMVVGTCRFFISWLTRKQRKLEVSSIVTLKGPPMPHLLFLHLLPQRFHNLPKQSRELRAKYLSM